MNDLIFGEILNGKDQLAVYVGKARITTIYKRDKENFKNSFQHLIDQYKIPSYDSDNTTDNS